MRTKNKEVMKNIVSSAKKEFFAHGYLEASMRNIANEANITPGNIYRYFESKEKLFDEIVHSVNKAISSLTKLENIVPSNVVLSSKGLVDYLIKTALDLAIKYKYETIILLSKSNGSKYEDSVNNFIEFTAKSINKTRKDDNIDLSRVIARSVIHTIMWILEEYVDDESKIKELSIEYLKTIFSSHDD